MGNLGPTGIGGGQRMEAFTVTIGTTQTTLASTTPVYTCTSQISSDGAKDEGGVLTWALDQLDTSSAFHTFVNTYAPADGVQATEDITTEDGTFISGATAIGTTLAVAIRGPLISGGADDGKRMSWLGLVKLSKSSGSVNFSANTYIKPPVTMTATKITTDLVFPTSVLGSYMVTAATQTIAATTHAYGKLIHG